MKPLLAALAVVAAGLVAVALHRWRVGAQVIGAGLCFAAAMRLSLPEERLGVLAVRSRLVDGGILLALGFGLVALANTIPARD